MAKSEILMWVAGIMMMIILGLAVAPTVSSAGNTARIAVVNSEVAAIRQAATLWISQNSPNGDFSGISADNIAAQLPALTRASNKFVSKANSGITYSLAQKTGDTSQITITVNGLTSISGAEASVKTSQGSISSNITDAVTTDGILVLDYRG